VTRRHAWSIRVRMTLVTTTIAALVGAVIVTLVVVGVRGRIVDYEQEKTTSTALETVHLIKRGRLPKVLPSSDDASVQVLNAQGAVVATTDDLKDAPRIADFVPSEKSVYASRALCPPRGLTGCMTVVSFRVYQSDGDWIVYAANELTPWYGSASLCVFIICGALLVVMMVGLMTWRTVDRTLAPVDAIRAELAEITATESGRRVPVPPNRDELRALAESANATLDRLDAALEQQRRFTSDASHDLRSPITAARTRLEEALMYPEDVDWPRVGEDVLGSLDRLGAIVSDLLELARLDAGAAAPKDKLDLGELVWSELSRTPRGELVHTHLADGVTVHGDRLRMARLLTNLLDNAERHAVSRIDITVRAEGDGAILEVTDDGDGIAPADRELVFQRFARLGAALTRDANGTGLGLPIAREVARAHGGTLTIEDSERGARFVLRLPRAN
jgi:signal transduction histidine kinase